jgi:hypothetical protein
MREYKVQVAHNSIKRDEREKKGERERERERKREVSDEG